MLPVGVAVRGVVVKEGVFVRVGLAVALTMVGVMVGLGSEVE
jgi:hypothetical protein